jgi:hypothetical protein
MSTQDITFPAPAGPVTKMAAPDDIFAPVGPATMAFLPYLFCVIPASAVILWKLFGRRPKPIELTKEAVLITGGTQSKEIFILAHNL